MANEFEFPLDDEDYGLPRDEMIRRAGLYGRRLEFNITQMYIGEPYSLDQIIEDLDFLKNHVVPSDVHKFYLDTYNELKPFDPNDVI